MLELRLDGIAFRYRNSSFEITGLDLSFDRNTHTALTGPAGGGKTTLLRLLGGALSPDGGRIMLGTREITSLRASRRPILSVGRDPIYPARWSVTHWLVAALRTRTLDREDRLRELELITENWSLGSLGDRRYRTLSTGEQLRLRLAVIEALHPAILLAERVLEGASPGELPDLADRLYRSLRVMGTTVISEISAGRETGYCDRAVVLHEGAVIQSGVPQELHERPASPTTAAAFGVSNLLEVKVRNGKADSMIGQWDAPGTPDGPGMAIIRADQFSIAREGEDSDLIFGIEEANFSEGRWHLRGMITGGAHLHVTLPGDLEIHKGRLLPLRYNQDRIVIFPGRRL
ncbi:MAG TPA: ATP-binding cassette domain-containing protein [Thermoanaerobaculia bacterium]|nr:ATP-binding cassette domain-containing protein [Thermoanaerobaculia bacterium]